MLQSLLIWGGSALVVVDIVLRVLLIIRVILRRTPVPNTLAWIVLLLLVPFFSLFLYFLIGEHRLGSRRLARYELFTQEIEARAVTHWHRQGFDWTGSDSTRAAEAMAALENVPMPFGGAPAIVPVPASITQERAIVYAPMSRLLSRLSSIPALMGNHLELIADNQHFLDRLIADIDRATKHVHLLYYIWEDDSKGKLIADAVVRAAARGVVCRVLVDSVGSASLIDSEPWDQMKAAGACVVEALPANPFRALFNRADLRNHRKNAIIDGVIGYCGSQNITEENFRKRLASSAGPWIDATVRMEGPAVQALQATFLRDWLLDSDEHLPEEELYFGPPILRGSSVVQVIPSGPGPRPDAIHQAFLSMLYAAREELIITTPYFVPDEATKGALINAAKRGVDVVIVVPQVTDNQIVASASRSHFDDLLDAGVCIKLHQQGLLHSKAAVVDRSFAVIGSANFDQRSFWLNFETTLFIYDSDFASQVRFLQVGYMDQSRDIEPHEWNRRPVLARFRDNCAQLLGPLL